MTSWSTKAADATTSLGVAFEPKKKYVLTPSLQRGKLLSTGRAQLVSEGEFEVAKTEATSSAVAAALGRFYTHSRCC